MASIKVVVRLNKKKKNNTVPLAIRITKDRKTRYIFTGKYIEPKHWDSTSSTVRKSFKNSVGLNTFLLKKLTEANKVLLDMEIKSDVNNASEIKKKLKNVKGASFYEVAEERIAMKRKAGVYSVANAERSILNNIKKYKGKGDLKFEEITLSWLQKFKVFCSSELNQKTRTVTNQLIFIRTLYNQAIKDGLAKTELYPFAGDKEKIRLNRSYKLGLSREEISLIENIKLDKNSSAWHTKNIFLFSFYFAGVRVSDVLSLKWSDFNDGRLIYVMNKNEKAISLKVPEKAELILEKYALMKPSKQGYVFPFLDNADQSDPQDVFRKTRNATKLFNKYLRRIADIVGIDKNISNHISRHSFGSIASESGVHPVMLQKLYRHSDLKTTLNYMSTFIDKSADEALEKVLSI